MLQRVPSNWIGPRLVPHPHAYMSTQPFWPSDLSVGAEAKCNTVLPPMQSSLGKIGPLWKIVDKDEAGSNHGVGKKLPFLHQ